MKYLDDILLVLGCCFILVFVHKIAPVYVWLVAGLMCVGLGVLVGMMNRNSK